MSSANGQAVADDEETIEKAKAAGGMEFTEIGYTGLQHQGGQLYEEQRQALAGDRGVAVYREMAEEDPTIGAGLLAIDNMVRRVPWEFEPAADSGSEGERWADHCNSAIHDMSMSWADTVSSFFTMVPFGWSYSNAVMKRRDGEKPYKPEDPDAPASSDYDDGLVGWRVISPRSQDSKLRWELDARGNVRGMWQQVLGGPAVMVPIEHSALFRTSTKKNSPEGLAMPLDTPIPTPDGWRTMGDLQAGDKVFDEQGHIRYVTATREWEDRPVMRLLFNDGSSIEADVAHQWFTYSYSQRNFRRPGSIRTTEEIANTLKTAAGHSYHAIPWAKSLDYPEQHLLADPYVLGLWLGDGTTLGAEIAGHKDDAEVTVRLIEEAGYPVKTELNGPEGCRGVLHRVGGGFRTQLRILGVLGDKHIPEQYLRGSHRQRLALLAGLMDSDGCVDGDGRCEFGNTNMNLIDGALELARSLGLGAKKSLRKHARPDRREAWAVKFTPTFPVFRFPRKNDRIKAVRAREWHYIVGAEFVDVKTTRCIEVDSPSHLYLAGESMIPTHNSVLRSAWRPWHFLRQIEVHEGIGIERDLAGLPVGGAPSEYLRSDAKPAHKATVAGMQRVLANVRANQNASILWPSDRDDNGNEMFPFKLMTSGSRRPSDLNGVIMRYRSLIAGCMLADWLTLGHEANGSRSLGSAKMDMFTACLGVWCQNVAGIFDAHLTPRLMRANGVSAKLSPKLRAGKVDQVDVEQFAGAWSSLITSGAITNDATTENWCRDQIGAPGIDEDDWAAAQAGAVPGEGAAA